MEKKLQLTPFGKFVNKYSVMVNSADWTNLFLRAQLYLDNGSDWKLFFDELIAGCTELRDGKLQEIICIMDEQNE